MHQGVDPPLYGVAVLGAGDGRAADLTAASVGRLLDPPAVTVRAHPGGRTLPVSEAPWWLLVDAGVAVNPWAGRHLWAAVGGERSGFGGAAPGPPPRTLAGAYGDFAVRGGRHLRRVPVGGWSPTRVRAHDYTGPVAMVRADLVEQALDSQHGDLRWEAVQRAGWEVDLAHVPAVLGVAADDRRWRNHGEPPVPPAPPGRVSVIIPTRGTTEVVDGRRVRLLDRCLESLVATAGHLDVEIVVVLDEDVATPVGAWQRRLGDRFVVTSTPPPFNFPGKIHAGVRRASGEFLLLLNDDVVAVESGWLTRMLAHAVRADVGAVGANLRYRDGTQQHAGLAFGRGGVHHIDGRLTPGEGPRGRDLVDREVSAVTAACLLQRREVWQQLGGLDPSFPVAFNDVDYCVRMTTLGYRVVQCNIAVLQHDESRTRAGHAQPWEVELMRTRFPDSLRGPDPWTPDGVPPASALRRRGLRSRWRNAREVYAAEGGAGVTRAVRARFRAR